MSSILREFLLPSLIVTLFASGCLTALLRRNGTQALLGIVLMSWAAVLLIGEVSVRTGNVDGLVLAVQVVFLVFLNAMTGLYLLRLKAKETDSIELDS